MVVAKQYESALIATPWDTVKQLLNIACTASVLTLISISLSGAELHLKQNRGRSGDKQAILKGLQ